MPVMLISCQCGCGSAIVWAILMSIVPVSVRTLKISKVIANTVMHSVYIMARPVIDSTIIAECTRC